jgi:hypothetical protein
VRLTPTPSVRAIFPFPSPCAASWRMRASTFALARGRPSLCLHAYPGVSLAEARRKGTEARESMDVHPTLARKLRVARNIEAGARTFKAVGEQWLARGKSHGYKRRGRHGTLPWSAHHVERNPEMGDVNYLRGRLLVNRFLEFAEALRSLPDLLGNSEIPCVPVIVFHSYSRRVRRREGG